MLLVVIMLIIVVDRALYNRYKVMITAILSVVGHLVLEAVVAVAVLEGQGVVEVWVGRVHLLEPGGFDKGYIFFCVWICVYMHVYILLVGASILIITW